MAGNLIVAGAGGQGISIADIALSTGWNVSAFLDPHCDASSIWGIPVVKTLPEDANGSSFAVGIGDNYVRRQVVEGIRAEVDEASFPLMIHPSSSVSPSAMVAAGCAVHAGAVVGPNSVVGAFSILGSHAVVDHDCCLGSFSSLGPGAILGGGVEIGALSVVGLGGVVKHGVRIERNVVLGAASYANRDLPANTVAIGIPVSFSRARFEGEPYL